MRPSTPDAVLDGIPAGARYVANNCCGTPSVLLDALGSHARRAGGRHVLTSGLTLGDHDLEPALRSGNLQLRSWHVHGAQRRLWQEGLVEYLPGRLGDLADTVLPGTDVALVRVAPPDEDGGCSLGPSASYSAALVEAAELVVAEIDEDVPAIPGAPRIDVAEIDRSIRTERRMPAYRPAATDEVARAVADQVIELLPAGATVQFGIGMVGEALAEALCSERAPSSLGLVGMVTDTTIPLAERIAANGRGPVAALEVMGGAHLMRWAATSDCVTMASSRVLHAPTALAQRPRLYSINSAVAVDLSGQVASESIEGRVVAGVGGSFDFFEGAHLSDGGCRIVALRSVTRRGQSTIVPTLSSDDAVALPRHSVDVVVTEHGAAWLTGRTLGERRAALLEVAAPQHRAELSRPARSTALAG